ncbi:MAG: hypothetical protein WBP45_06765 [Daejeonella sp.]
MIPKFFFAESSEMIKPILLTLIGGFIIWIANTLHNYFIKVRPRLYVSTNKILYNQHRDNYGLFSFEYMCEIKIKNNSKYPAERIHIIFPELQSISDKPSETLLEANNHLESYKILDLTTSLIIKVPVEKVCHVEYENDIRVITPGTIMPDPPEYFKPDALKHIIFILKYKSENNKVLYTVYQNKEGLELNKIFLFNPLFFVNIKFFRRIILR